MHTTINAATSSSIDIPIFRAEFDTKSAATQATRHTKFPLKTSTNNKQRRVSLDDAPLECCSRSITPNMQPPIGSGIRPSHATIIVAHDGAV
jgi:hypothetical protein